MEQAISVSSATTRTPVVLESASGAHRGHRGLHNRVILFRTSRFTVVTFGLFAALGVALSSWMALVFQIRSGLQPGRYAAAMFLGLPLAILLGSRLFSVLLDGRSLRADPWGALRRTGFAFQGGLVATILGIAAIARAYALDPLALLDTFALALPLGHAVGRLGCLTYGCCHGKPTTAAWGIVYTHPESKAVWRSQLGGVRLHPTQLYSCLANLGLTAVLAWAATFPLRPGQLAGLYLLAGSLGRFSVELWRGVPVKRVAGLSPFQLMSLGLAAAGASLLALSARAPHAAPLVDARLLQAAAASTAWLYLPVLVFGLMFLAFGLHGPRVGKL